MNVRSLMVLVLALGLATGAAGCKNDEPDGSAEALTRSCERMCGLIQECGFEDEFEEGDEDWDFSLNCTQMCQFYGAIAPFLGGECARATNVYMDCLSRQTCSSLDTEDVCAAEDRAADAACGWDDE